MSERTKNILALAIALAACYGVAGFGGVFTAGAVRQWYPTLVKPAWTPPSWLFGPVWTVLYGLMAVAVWLVWLRRGRGRVAWPIALFVVQLALNAAWSPVFFGLRQLGAGLAVIIAMWLAIVATTWAFFRRRALAGWLMLPYLAWVSYAATLNFALWRLNP